MKIKRALIFLAAVLIFLSGSAGFTKTAYAENNSDVEAENTDGDNVYISNDGTEFTIPSADSANQEIFDYADLFTDAEEQQLETEKESLEAKKQCDIIILTLTSNEIPYDAYDGNDTTRAYAEQFYMDNGFADDAVILTIDMHNRVIYITGHGTFAAEDFQNEIETIYKAVRNKASDGAYADAAEAFLDQIDRYKNPLRAAVPTVVSLIISAVLSVLTMIILWSRHKSVQAVKYTAEGVPMTNYRVLKHDVRYMGTMRHVRHIPPPPPSGGSGRGGGFSGGMSSGGGFSGGGGSFSGGGGKF